MASASSWLTSLKCSMESPGTAKQWLEFIFLSPCPQRLLLSVVDLLFLLTLFVIAVPRLVSRFKNNGHTNSGSSVHKPLLESENPHFLKATLWFRVSLILAALLGLYQTVVCVLAFIEALQSPWNFIEAFFRLFQAITYVAMSAVIAHEKKFGVLFHHISLRIYWIVSLVIATLFAASAVARVFFVEENMVKDVKIDDIFSLVSFPVHVYYFIVAIKGSSGIIVVVQEDLSSESSINGGSTSNVSGYATASLLSKAMWLWINPVLNEGYKSPLSLEKVPLLPPQFKAEKTAEIFEKNWPKTGENLHNQARTTLIRCFWKPLSLTALIALVRLLVQYTGPILIQSFVKFTSGDRSNILEGYYLVLILLIAKIVEVFCSHHLNFLVGNLGMLIRSSLIAALYKKGLRLSCSSRQAHGVGQIVNYMAVDTQQLFDMMPQLHSLWTTPLQIIVSLVLLYNYIGLSMLVSFAAIIATMIFTLMITSKNGFYQFNAMKTRDSRLKTTSELLNNMRVIKFQAWEEHFRKRIQSFRDAEFGWVTKFLYLVSCNLTVLWSVPILISALTFTVAALTNVNLSSGTVFTITSILRILQEPIRTFPQSLISISQALISLTRLDVYLKSNELDTDAVERKEGCDSNVAVEVRDGCFSWEDEEGEEILKNINFNVNKGELAAIVGTVGSGKSSLLAAVLGELKKTDGTVRVCGTTAYVAQSSWICNATIQENILFGSPMDVQKYKEVIKVCALEKDLEIMEYGDKTEIGERGINLSGGQKQRIQLARAVYQDCDIYLLDDIFSAVDAHTGSEIFKECVRGALKKKTILLVTHQVDFLHNADIIMVMRDGKIVQSGKYEELLESGLDFGDLVAAHETSVDLVEKSTHLSNGNLEKTPISPHLKTPKSPGKQLSLVEEPNGESNLDKGSSKLIEDEERETGHVSSDVYKQYCTEAYGWWGVAGVVIASLLWQASLMAGDYWLAYETSEDHFNPRLFIKVYVGIAIVSCVLVSIRSFIVTFIGLKTAQMFFQQLLNSTLHAPMSFFDTTPSGRILSRVSSDQVNIDILIPLFMSLTIAMYFTLLSILFITCQYAWPTVFLMIPLAWLNIWYRRYFLASSRELTRLEGITKAPVIHHFSETISGVMTIRCYRKEDQFFQESFDRLNANLQMIFHNNASNEWLGIRMEMLGSLLLCISALFMVLLPATIIKPEYVGLSLSYGLSLNGILYWAVYMSCFVENRMVSVERIKQFVNIPSEAAWKLSDSSLSPPNWPHHGDIETTSLQVRYREHTPLVLKGISVSIRGGEKIGVVGRTGSGKSTLIQVFFRLVEPCGGRIVIDGIDISKLGLHYLRSRFGIIPQEPVLFEGSIRSNIDPIGLYSDDEIWKSLDRCQLKDVVAAKPEKLDSLVVDGGDNYSVGQRQLLCLGRVMLKRSKILFMDEATASVDSQTDAVIQKIIREDFTTSTIITIAHRIPTVIDCDRVLVIDDGLAKEFDTPSSLLGRRSLFAALVQEYANRSNNL